MQAFCLIQALSMCIVDLYDWHMHQLTVLIPWGYGNLWAVCMCSMLIHTH